MIDAAEHAKEHNKLITTRLPNFDVKRLPVEFERRQAYPVTDRDRLMEALASFGLKRAPKAGSHLTRGEVRRAAKTDKEWARIANEESVEAKAKYEKRLLQRADRLTERYPRLYVIAGAVLFGVLAFWWLFA